MAPRKKMGNTPAAAEPSPWPEPTLNQSMMINWEGLDKVRHAIAADSDEWKATKV